MNCIERRGTAENPYTDADLGILNLVKRIYASLEVVNIIPETSRIRADLRRGERREMAHSALCA